MGNIFLFAIILASIAGCKEEDSAPNYSDVKNITVDGQHYTASAYAHEFCQKADSPKSNNCVAVWHEAETKSSDLMAIPHKTR
jgi:hypothetical protein